MPLNSAQALSAGFIYLFFFFFFTIEHPRRKRDFKDKGRGHIIGVLQDTSCS